MSSQAPPSPGAKRRRLPSIADLALLCALILVLALSWHGLPNPHAEQDPSPGAPAEAR